MNYPLIPTWLNISNNNAFKQRKVKKLYKYLEVVDEERKLDGYGNLGNLSKSGCRFSKKAFLPSAASSVM